jgi:hypothetical protein
MRTVATTLSCTCRVEEITVELEERVGKLESGIGSLAERLAKHGRHDQKRHGARSTTGGGGFRQTAAEKEAEFKAQQRTSWRGGASAKGLEVADGLERSKWKGTFGSGTGEFTRRKDGYAHTISVDQQGGWNHSRASVQRSHLGSLRGKVREEGAGSGLGSLRTHLQTYSPPGGIGKPGSMKLRK